MNVFRAYDIRGVADRDLPDEFMRSLGLAIGTQLVRLGGQQLALGRDARLHSPRLHAALLDGLLATPITVFDTGVLSTPQLYHATHHLGCDTGAMITASHNPAPDNGLKLLYRAPGSHRARLHALPRLLDSADFVRGSGRLVTPDPAALQTAYLDFLVARLSLGPRRFPLVVDAAHGMAGPLIAPLFARLGFPVHALSAVPDGRFPLHPPDPTEPAHLERLLDAVSAQHVQLGFAFDGDADRLVVVDDQRRIIWGDELLILLGRHILATSPGARFVCEVRSTRAVFDELTRAGGEVIMWRVGHTELREKLHEAGAALAAEVSGHLFFADRHLGYDDALYAAARLLEVLTQADDPRTLAQHVDTLPRLFRTPELRLPVPEPDKPFVLAYVRDALHALPGVSLLEIDGVRVQAPTGWALLRASNTTPALALRVESSTAAGLADLRSQILDLVAAAKAHHAHSTLPK